MTVSREVGEFGGQVGLVREMRLPPSAGLCHESGMAKRKKNAAVVALGRLGGDAEWLKGDYETTDH